MEGRSSTHRSRRRSVGSALIVAVALVGVLVALPSSAVAATTWFVNDTTGSDANTCTTALSPCKTIQAAINKAAAGDTINVADGLYLEPAGGPLTVNKTLTLLGEQAGVDARTRAGAESIIADSQGTSVSASDVVIDGFTVQGSTNPAFTGYGLWLNPTVSGTQIVNNIIQDNIVGIGLANAPGGTSALIEHNLIRNNNNSGGATGSGIYTDQFVGGPSVRNVVVNENTFAGHGNSGAAINISNTAFGTGGVFGLSVTDNLFTANNRAFVLFNTHDSTFDGNRISGSTFVGSADIRIFDGNSGLDFTNNDLSDGVGHAARLSAIFATPSSDVEFHYNNFERYGLTGLTVDASPLGHTGTVDAECNWWNSSTGPTNPDNPSGTGEEVAGDADFSPWLTARAPGGRCVGIVSTPGKVTGGGQIEGDPVFSPVGTLLSIPAIVPSASGGSSQASFGFVANCCPATGNLQYHDHGADVRIKALSIAALSIGSPGTSCAATPGSKHATFTGTATVTRPTGTTTEDFVVEVDDCGEPGTADTFGITTTTYSNGPNVLVGGNIQIHK